MIAQHTLALLPQQKPQSKANDTLRGDPRALPEDLPIVRRTRRELTSAFDANGLDGMCMDTSVVTALAALAGAAIGGLTSFLASWLSQRAQARIAQLAHYQLRRQELYKEFIEQASKLYIHALQSDKPDVSSLMGLYAEVSRMRILSSIRVIESADQIVKKIITAYLDEPNKTFPELRQMADSGLIDPLRNFSEACRAESEALGYGPPG